MAKKVLSIEISRTLIKICEVDYKVKNPKVHSCFTLHTPDGVFDDGFLTDTEVLSEFIKDELSIRQVKTKDIVFTLSSSRIANREVFIPFVKEKQIAAIISANAADYFPVDITGYQLTYNILDTVEREGQKQYKLLVLAAPKAMLEQYYEMSKAAGLVINAIDYAGNSIVPVVKGAITDEPTMIIKVDEHTTLLTILKNKAVVLQRSLNNGADVAVETVCDNEVFEAASYEEALNTLRGKTLIRNSFDESFVDVTDEEADDEKYRMAKIDLTYSLRGLVSSIVRVVDYYNSRNQDDTIKHFLLTGFGGDFSGLSKLLTHEIGEKVTVLAHVDGISLEKGTESERVSFGEYIACIGAAIDPVDFVPDERKPGAKKKGGNIFTADLSALNPTQVSIIVCAVGVLAAIGLAAFSLIKVNSQEMEKARLEEDVRRLEPIVIVYNEYNGAKELYDDARAMYELTRDNNEAIIDFLDELKTKFPSDICITSFISDKEKVSITFTVKSEAAAGKVLEALRSFVSIKNIETTGIDHDVEGEGTQTVWKATVTGYYDALKPYPDTIAEEQQEAGGEQ